MNIFQKFQQRVWRMIYPVFPQIEHHLIFLHQKKRQKFHIGWLPKGKTLHDLKDHLSSQWAFGNHFVAWEDPDQVLSWRKLIDFDFQYHLRVYHDGEIRGHLERTPEASPLRHFFEKGEKAKTKDFMNFLRDFVTTKKYISDLHGTKRSARATEITA